MGGLVDEPSFLSFMIGWIVFTILIVGIPVWLSNKNKDLTMRIKSINVANHEDGQLVISWLTEYLDGKTTVVEFDYTDLVEQSDGSYYLPEYEAYFTTVELCITYVTNKIEG